MKIAVIVVAISCFSAIEGATKEEYDFDQQVTQVNQGEMKSCIKGLHFNIDSLLKAVKRAQLRVQNKLKVNNDTLIEMKKCYLDTVPQELNIKPKQNHFDQECLNKIPGLEQTDINKLNRIINAFNRDVKEIGGDQDESARNVFVCMRLYSEGSFFILTSDQRKCIDNFWADKSFEMLKLRVVGQQKYRRLKLTKEELAAIEECILDIDPSEPEFYENIENFDQECLKKYPDFNAKADQYNKNINEFHMQVLRLAGNDAYNARWLLECTKSKPNDQTQITSQY